MFGLEVKNSKGETIIDNEHKLAKLREIINATIPDVDEFTITSEGFWEPLTTPTSNDIFAVIEPNSNFGGFINKYGKNNGKYEAVHYYTDGSPGDTIKIYVYEIE